MANGKRKVLLICAGLAAVVSIAYSPVLRNGFTGYDDPDYVLDNVHVRSGLTGEGVRWALTAAHSHNWHPLTWLSHALDATLFGLSPAGHHCTSLLLHIANTLLLFWWLNGATGRTGRSAFVAAGFGLHPLHVESVAWVAERKDVLSTGFWILGLIAYTAYVKRPGVARYLAVAACLAAGLLSKPMLVSFPVLLWVVDWWPLKRGGRFVLEKVPLLLLSAVSCGMTLWAQGSALAATGALPLRLRLGNAAASYIRYLGKTLWPARLSAFYPFQAVPAWKVVAALAALAGVSALVIMLRRTHPWLVVGWCWYLITLLPVIGIVQVGMQAIADRYMYVPMIGLLIALAWETGEHAARVVPAVAVLLLAAWAILSWHQIAVWHDGVTLWSHAIEVDPENFAAHDNLGVELDRRGRPEEALAQYRETLRIRPDDRNGQNNYAAASFEKAQRLLAGGQMRDAIAAYRETLRYRPGNVLGQIGLGVALARTGQAVEARQAFQNALRYDPDNVEAHYDLGLVLSALGQSREALAQFDAALRLNPNFVAAQTARAEILRGQ